MTDEPQRPNGSAASSMTASKGVVQGNGADSAKAPKSGSPSKDKGPASGSEAPTRTPKKRRKVNHGKADMLCALDSVNGLADPECSL